MKIGWLVGWRDEDGKWRSHPIAQVLPDGFLIDLGDRLWYINRNEIAPPF